jgi:hypothetical protein
MPRVVRVRPPPERLGAADEPVTGLYLVARELIG